MTYRIVFRGQVAPGVELETAKANLQRLLKTDAATLEKLFSGKAIVLKKGLDEANLERYQKALEKTGIEFEIDPPLQPASSEWTLEEQAPTEPPAEPESTEPQQAAPESEAPALSASAPASEAEAEHDPYTPPAQSALPKNKVHCRHCGELIHPTSRVCFACGGKQLVGKARSKGVAATLAILLGFFGAHRFYLGQWWGLIYFFFGIVAWPIAIIEGIVFLATPRERWEEKYGNVLGLGTAVTVVIIALFAVAMLGIVAAIAIPAYSDYQNRAKVASAMQTVDNTRLQVEAFIQRVNFIPNSNLDAGLSESISGENVESIELGTNAVMTVTLDDPSGGPIDAETMIWVPKVKSGNIQWDCSGGSLPSKYRPQRCRQGSFTGQQASADTEWVTSADGLVQIRVPSNWTQMDSLTEAGSLEYANLLLEQYLVVLSEPKQDFGKGMDLQAYTQILLEQNYAGLKQKQIDFIGTTSVNNLPAMQYMIRGEADGIRIRYLLNTIESDTHYHQVLFWTLPSKWEQNESVFIETLMTFKEVGTP